MNISGNLREVSIKDIFRVGTDFQLAARTTNRMINQPPEKYNINGTDIFEEDWDNLILLDSCRYDYFSHNVPFSGKLESRESRGSGTPEFIRGNFQGPDRLDTVYVSANGWYKKISEELGELRSDVFLFDHVTLQESERELGHVRRTCNKVTERTLTLHEKYPNKRLIVHYMPPHRPYVDEYGDIIVDFERSHTMDTFFNLAHRSSSRPGHITQKEIQSAYESSVIYTLDHIQKLVNRLDGLTIISADHGELLAERSRPIPIIEKSHPRGVYIDPLVKVPWFALNNRDRRKIIEAENPHQSIEKSREISPELDDHLRDLGYKV